MSLAGTLRISLVRGKDGLACTIASSRPLAAARIFAGQPVAKTLQRVPLLFNVCARAQASSLVRAVESAGMREAGITVASQREAMVRLESLREQLLRVLLDWPASIGEDGAAMQRPLAAIVRGTVALTNSLQPERLCSIGAEAQRLTAAQRRQWRELATLLDELLFACPAEEWLGRHAATPNSLRYWITEGDTVATRFLEWLSLRRWRHAGSSPVVPPPALDDAALAQRLRREGERFTARPDWRGNSHEMSWLRGVLRQPLVRALLQRHGNGIQTRSVARLVAIATVVDELNGFFLRGETLSPPPSLVPGMAHTEAARGRLTHLVELDGERLARLLILAPTEWNFHPRGVAALGLENLRGRDEALLRRQATLLIHAIDPCVGYSLNIVAAEGRRNA